MAEFVEQCIEETIPEVEELERIGLLSSTEVKKLVQKRREHQYRLARRSKRKCDFVDFANYEQKLIELIRIRRKQIGIHEKRGQIETPIARRVLKYLRFLTRAWPAYLDTWAHRISFARFIGWKEEIASAFTEQVGFHGNKESVWVSWAKWEVEEHQNFDHARTILLSKASSYHPKSPLIKRELFRLELLYVESLLNKVENDNIAGLEEVIAENREKVLRCAVPRAVYQDTVTTLPDPEVYLQFYQVAYKFQFAHKLCDEIYRDLCIKFPDAHCVWKLKTQRLVSGLQQDNAEEIKEESEEDDVNKEKECKETTERKVVSGMEDAKDNRENIDEASEGGKMTSDKQQVEVNCVESESSSNLGSVSGKDKHIIVKPEPGVSDNILEQDTPKSIVELDPMQKLKVIISTFDAAVSVVGASFVSTYVKELLPLLRQCWGIEPMAHLVLEKLQHLCQSHTAVLTPLHFYIWLQVLCEQNAPSEQLRDVLDQALHHHPDVASLKLEHIKLASRNALSDAVLLQEVDKMGKSLGGWCGLEAWREIAKRVTDEKMRIQIMEQAADHQDPTVSLGMRTLYLKHVVLQKGIKGARQMYKKFSWRPPLSCRLHAQMVELELTQMKVKVEAVRQVFHNATQQHGTTHPGVWLAYIQFEKQRGDPLKAGALCTRAERELEAAHAHVFRQLNLIIRDLLNKEISTATEFLEENGDGSILIDTPGRKDIEDEGEEWIGPGLVQLLPEEPTLTYTAHRARTSFFSSLVTIDKQLAKGDQKVTSKGDNGSEWEEVVKLLLGQHVPLSVHLLKVDQLKQVEKLEVRQGRLRDNTMIAPRFKKRNNPTNCLDPGTDQEPRVKHRDDSVQDYLAKALKSSAVLQPEFMQKTIVGPLMISKKKAKEERKRQQSTTKGPGWFDMKAPEVTEEVKRDLEILQMRSVLDPRRHYKASDMKVLPKYFQLARVVDSPVDFYSSRVPKKQRKRTLADEIMNDEEALRYQKRKYTEIVAAKQKKIKNKTGRKGNRKGSGK